MSGSFDAYKTLQVDPEAHVVKQRADPVAGVDAGVGQVADAAGGERAYLPGLHRT